MIEPTDNRIYEVLEESSTSSPHENNLTVLSSGAVLRHKPVPPMILAKIDEKFPDPPVPMVRDEDKGRTIPNPVDPSYLKSLEANQMKKGLALVDVLIGMGTTIEHIPDNMQRVEDEEWAENLIFVGIEVPQSRLGRYLAYVKYYAAESAEDIQKLAKKGSAALGVTDSEVATALAAFPSHEERSTYSGNQT